MKNKTTLFLILQIIIFSITADLFGQTESDERPLLEIEDGISIKKDSLFLLNLRFRIQNRAGVFTRNFDDFTINEVEARVRRLRVRFDGFVKSKKLGYYIQLSFSRADQDLETSIVAQTVRDAILYCSFSNNFYIGFGQSKLPGNRQRVISSGNLQMPDRSIVNQRMTLDRDFGFFTYGKYKVGKMLFNIKSAITTGDGRNALVQNDGIAYTGRVEWLPFGAFKDNGDYSEGDIAFEERPKISLAASYSYNHKAIRTGGQLGNELFETRNIETIVADFIFKYKGWAIQSEYVKRNTPNQSAITSTNDALRFVYVGEGHNTQISKMISKKTEIAGRFAVVKPDIEISLLDPSRYSVLGGVTHYLNGHRIKAQLFGGIEKAQEINSRSFLSLMFQVEFGI